MHYLWGCGVTVGCVSSLSASVSCLIAVGVSSNPRELAAYLASFWASDTAAKEGWKPGAARGMAKAAACAENQS